MSTYKCKPSEVLQPSFPKLESNYEFKPDDTVYTITGYFDGAAQFLDAMAFKTDKAAKTHWWCTQNFGPDRTEIHAMTVQEFFTKRSWQGMNPFETLNQAEFITRYRELYSKDVT